MSTADSTEADCIKIPQGKVFLKKGDLIEFKNSYYYPQWAVYIGNMKVAYAEPSKNNAVMITNLQEVRGNRR